MLRRAFKRTVLHSIAVASVVAWASGCRSPGDYRREADRVAYNTIRQKQAEALGHTELFTIETPADTLRRRLLLDQHLPYASPASLGARDIQPIDQWPDDDYLETNGPPCEIVESMDTAGSLVLTLADALQIGAHGSREYQTGKEQVFEAALDLDLENDAFRNTWAGALEGLFQADLEEEVEPTGGEDIGETVRKTVRDSLIGAVEDFIRTRLAGAAPGADGNGDGAGDSTGGGSASASAGTSEPDVDRETVAGVQYGGVFSWTRKFKSGTTFTGQIGLDLVSLLTQDRLFSRGIFADVTITIPLLRGAGEFVVTEPLTQAERDVVYALYEFERFKRQFAVDVASEYLAVLRQLDSVQNAEDNYRRLIASTRRARRLADTGRLPEIQVDQSRQDELRARNQWVSAQESYQRQLDGFKLTLGLPTDARLELDRGELDALGKALGELLSSVTFETVEEETPAADAPIELVPPGMGNPGRYELDEAVAIVAALQNRLDLRVAVGRVHDAQRTVAVAADQLRADITLLGSGSAGARRALSSVSQDDSILRPNEGVYSALLTIDLPFERTAERNTYRTSLIRFEQAIRDVQALEDQIKLEVRNGLSRLLEARESIQIQAEAVTVAQRRVASTNLFLEAGRAEIRDVLEAQDALVNAQNALTAALVSYRVNELSLQRDLDVLVVDERGLLQEDDPADWTD